MSPMRKGNDKLMNWGCLTADKVKNSRNFNIVFSASKINSTLWMSASAGVGPEVNRQSYRKLLIILLEPNAAINLITADRTIFLLLFCAFPEPSHCCCKLPLGMASFLEHSRAVGVCELLFYLGRLSVVSATNTSTFVCRHNRLSERPPSRICPTINLIRIIWAANGKESPFVRPSDPPLAWKI